jgi:hypothetical protein
MRRRAGRLFQEVRRTPTRKLAIVLVVMVLGACRLPAQATSGKHTFTVKVKYDFRMTPACSEKVKKNCVMRFNLYDLSAGYKNRTKLFSIEVGEVREKGVKEFPATSPLLLFESGKHLIGVSAEGPDKLESDPRLCKTWVEIP